METERTLESSIPGKIVLRTVKSILSAVFLTGIYYIFLFKYQYSFNYGVDVNFHCFLLLLSLIFFSTISFLHFISEEKIRINIADLPALIFTACSFICILTNHRSLNLNNEHFICCLVALFLYFAIRASPFETISHVLTMVFPIFFLVELYSGIGQYLLNVHLNDRNLLITGSFGNSGIYSAYLVINLPFCFFLVNKWVKNPTAGKLTKFAIAILVAFIIYQTQSRTAIFMFLALCIFMHGSRLLSILKARIIPSPRNLSIFCFVCLSVIAAGCYLLVQVKPNSFFGRMFVWQIALQHIPDNLFTGIGPGNFSLYYPQWQVQYIATHNDLPPSFFLNAGEVFLAFNEFLQLLIEMGIFGLGIFVVFLIYLLFQKQNDKKTYTSAAKMTLTMILIAGLFSYPFHCNAAVFIFTFCVALLASQKQIRLFTFKRRIFPFIPSVTIQFTILAVVLKCLAQCQAITEWESFREDLLSDKSAVEQKYKKAYRDLKTNGKFMLDFGEHLTEADNHKAAIIILEASKNYYISSRTYISTANAYYHVGNLAGALNNLRQAIDLIPSGFYTRYELAKLLYESGDSAGGRQEVEHILSMPVKKMSQDVLDIKARAKQLTR